MRWSLPWLLPEVKEPWEAELLERPSLSVMSRSLLVVGCQSMGCIRSSNELEGLNFHLRMIVQIRAAKPMEPPIAAMMMMVLRWSLVTLPEEVEGAWVEDDVGGLVTVLVT